MLIVKIKSPVENPLHVKTISVSRRPVPVQPTGNTFACLIECTGKLNPNSFRLTRFYTSIRKVDNPYNNSNKVYINIDIQYE